MQKKNRESLKALNDPKKRIALVQKLLGNPEGATLIEWMRIYYSGHSINMENSNHTYYNLGRIDVIKDFENYLTVELKETK